MCCKAAHKDLVDSRHYSTATESCLLNICFETIMIKNIIQEGTGMEIKDILKNLREKNNLTQEQLAERVQVTRQAVSPLGNR